MVGTYKILSPLKGAPNLRGWVHGDPVDAVAPHVMVPFWFTSLVVRRKWSIAGAVEHVGMRLHGPQPQSYVHKEEAGVELIGVEVTPEYAHAALGHSTSDLISVHLDWESAPYTDVLKFAESGAPAYLVADRLTRRIAERSAPLAASPAARAARMVRRASGQLPLRILPDKLGVSERTLRNSFKALMGISAKSYARIVRLNALVHAADQWHRPNWADLAVACGHYDQAHMIKAVREMTGLTPARLHESRRREAKS